MEKWKAVPGTNGKIEVSDRGRVRSFLRGEERILKTQADTKGYRRVSVTIDRVKRTYKLHRLVAKAFIPNPDGLQQVNHIDGCKSNNAVSNLEWISNRDNCHHAIENGLWDTVIEGAARHNASVRRPVVGTKDGVSVAFCSVSEAERQIGSRHITDVLKGKRDHVKGWTFRYAEGGDAV